MALNETMTITADSDLLASSDYLGRITGLRSHDDILAQALAFTAGTLENTSRGYLLRIYHQSMKQDWFDYPINLTYLYIDMKRRKSGTAGTLDINLSAESQQHLQTIAGFMRSRSEEDIIHFSVHLAHTVANDLRKGGGVCRLAYVDGSGRRPFILTQTPYDRTLRNEFNRLLLEFHERWKNSPGKTNPPSPPPAP